MSNDKIIKLFNDSDPKVRALYDALIDVLNEERFCGMCTATIVGTIETLKINVAIAEKV